jgi:8-oxo-dGTP pyrophosphatase MutT (NUDIX family)
MTYKTESAGGVVVNKKGRVLVVSQHGTSWSLPKGHIDPGETKLQAAIREIEEESGIRRLTLVKDLGFYSRYKLGLGSKEDMGELKTLHMFLFTTDEERFKPVHADHPEVRWVRPDDVEALLTHPKDKLFFKSIRSQVC